MNAAGSLDRPTHASSTGGRSTHDVFAERAEPGLRREPSSCCSWPW
ncbi:MAG: hypothetical protein MZV70_49780 [Desulfobacterales bacterium]|nr:hypothetical protein [Desulfobacterales bacterium]